MVQSPAPLNYASGPLSSLGLYARRVTRSVVGRPHELAAVEQELGSAQSGMVCLTVEGEPGIGKTRLLLAVEELARAKGFTSIAVTADEEIRGPFMLARSIFGSPAATEGASGAPAKQAMQRVCDALSSLDEPGLENLAPDRKLVRVLDLAAMAVRALAAERPLAVLIDDVQWTDEDSLRLLRYVVRTTAASRVLLVLASLVESHQGHYHTVHGRLPFEGGNPRLPLVVQEAAGLQALRLLPASSSLLAHTCLIRQGPGGERPQAPRSPSDGLHRVWRATGQPGGAAKGRNGPPGEARPRSGPGHGPQRVVRLIPAVFPEARHRRLMQPLRMWYLLRTLDQDASGRWSKAKALAHLRCLGWSPASA